MDVRISTPPTPQPAAAPTPAAQGASPKEVARRVPPPETVKTDNKPQEQRQQEQRPKAEPVRSLPRTTNSVRVELMVDDRTNEVFGRVINRQTGEEIRQIPAEDIRQLQAISREMFGSILDKTV